MSAAWSSGLGRLSRVGIVAADFGDARHARMIYLAAGGLVALGIGLTVATVIWWRSSRVEHPVLAPLEVMSDRAWTRANEAERRRVVDAVRPPGAAPLVVREVRREPALDLAALGRAEPAAFDDLAEVALPSDRVPAVAAPVEAAAVDAPAPEVAEVAPPAPEPEVAPVEVAAVDADVVATNPAPRPVDPLLRSWTGE